MLGQQVRNDLVYRLAAHRAYRQQNPFANPVQLLSLDLSRRLSATADTLTLVQLTDLVQYLTLRTFDARIMNTADRVEEVDTVTNDKRLRAALKLLTSDNQGNLVPFAQYRKQVETELLGIVFTAHPTFSLEADLYRVLAQLATGRDLRGNPLTDGQITGLRQQAAAQPHRPSRQIDLSGEFALSIEAIDRFSDAVNRIRTLALEVAAQTYPDGWQVLQPKLLTASSWVGYDLDGRSDISWADSLKARLKSAIRAIERYRGTIDTLRSDPVLAGGENALTRVDEMLGRAGEIFHADLAVLQSDQTDLECAKRLSHRFVNKGAERITSLAAARAGLRGAVADISDTEGQVKILALVSEMAAMGFGMGMAQVRLNATQLNNVARSLLGIERQPGDKASRRRHLKELEARFDTLESVPVGVSSLFTEKTTARRLMMFLRLVLDHVDSELPIRFLVAEAESPLSILTALYFAKLFGVEDKVDLSPLFETPLSLERGPGIIEELLEDAHFVRYVRRRGRLCVQAGYSDAGRFIGQPAAALAVERVRIKLAQLLERQGLTDIEVVIFNTHGESMGRGAHPKSIVARLNYLVSPASVHAFRNRGIQVLEEISFQGGDGYAHFLQPDLAYATVSRLLEARLDGLNTKPAADALYDDNIFSLEFFLRLKEYQERLVEDPGYAAILSSFGINLLYPTGSRMMQRQHEQPALVERSHPSQLRAIPHNAILQQLGFPANVLAGLGEAADLDSDRFKSIVEHSDRLHHVLEMAHRSWQVSNLDAMGGYLAIYDPQTWLQRAASETDQAQAEEFENIANMVSKTGIYNRIRPTYQKLMKDSLKLRRAWQVIGMTEELAADLRDDMDILHAARQALIQEAFILANRVPRFSSQPQITVSDILSQIIHLDMGRALDTLRTAYPLLPESINLEGVFDDAGYHFESGQDYRSEHEHIFAPLEDIYDVIRRIGISLSHVYGALG